MATTPTVNKRQLGALIRKLRTSSDPLITQQDLGARAFPRLKPGSAQGKIANIEAGERSLDHRDLDLILDALGVTDQGVIDWAREKHANTSQRGRWNGDRAFYSEEFRTYVDLEEDSDRIRVVSVNIVPDLLNEETCLREMWSPYAETRGQNWVERAVRSRLLRQRILDASAGRRFEFLLCESAVRRRHGGMAAHRRQLREVIRRSTQPNIAVRIVPFDQSSADAATAVRSPFVTFRVPSENVVPPLEFLHYGNDPADNRYFCELAKTGPRNALFENAWTATLDEDASRRFLEEIIREYR